MWRHGNVSYKWFYEVQNGHIQQQDWHGLTLILAWINNYIHYNVWDKITYPFPNLDCVTIDIWEWISNFVPDLTCHVTTQD